MADGLNAGIDFGREICGNLAAAESREWLVTNGLGGFASGTVAGSLTRRYHGLLVAALQPPVGRALLVAKVDETARYGEENFSLGTNRWTSGASDPQGYRLIESYGLDGTTPVWTFALRQALLEKRVWMEQGSNTTYLRYHLARGAETLHLAVKVLVNYRDYHATTHAGNWQMRIEAVPHGMRVTAFPGATPFYLLSAEAPAEPAHDWYRDFELPAEQARGLDHVEDHLHAATFHASLAPGHSVTLVLTTDAPGSLDGHEALARQRLAEQQWLEQWTQAHPTLAARAPQWIRQLVLAAHQFIVRRSLPEDPDARSIIAGYHWFGDWGRDTMVSLPGLTLWAGQPAVARKILLAFGHYVQDGMLPNCFPEGSQPPLYNTVDAALWFILAAGEYFDFTKDTEFLQLLYPVLLNIVARYIEGTRYNIHVDPADGLLYAGAEGVQLTWMDAKVGDWVVTPRIGKPVEVNALWLNALASMARLAASIGRPGDRYDPMLARARRGFARFWNERLGCCFDVLDGPQGEDASVRPNQILAVSLPETALTAEQQRAVVKACGRHLLTSFGLRSLAASSPGYRGTYGGPPSERDAAYHQGTVWGWLLGPFAVAYWRVYHDRAAALSFLEPMRNHLKVAGLGTASEIFQPEPPFEPCGAIAQAWTVAETLRAWSVITAA